MMKALLFCPVRGNTWLKQYFPNYPVYLLPFANKPAIEFALDYCFLKGIRDVRIISDEESDVLHARFRRDGLPGMNVSFGGVQKKLKKYLQSVIKICVTIILRTTQSLLILCI